MDTYIDRLSDYLDGELAAAEHADVDAHVAACAECGAVLDDLRRIRDEASALPPLEPARDLWPDIAAQLGAAPGVLPLQRKPPFWRRPLVLTVPQLAAAGLILALASAGAVRLWYGANRAEPGELAGATSPATGAPGQGVLAGGLEQAPAVGAALGLERAVQELERTLLAERGRLDAETVAVLEQNLALIDAAIAEIRTALERDPGSMYLNRSLTSTMRRKLGVLQVAATQAAQI